MVRLLIILGVALVAGCGRIQFDPDPARDSGGPGPMDGPRDAAGDDAPSDAALSALAQRAYVKASNTDAGDQYGFGLTLSADGSTLAVCAWLEGSAAIGIGGNQADNSAATAGAVYVYTRADMAWTQQAYVKASNTESGDQFGFALALSPDGSTLAVGAPFEGSAAVGVNGNQADNTAPGSGAVYVFTRAGVTWTQQAYVKASNTNMDDGFGIAVALSGDGSTLAVGASRESSAASGIGGDQASNAAAFSGAAYVFTRAVTTWSQQAYVKASNTGPSDLFGATVALSADGSTLAAAAILESSAATGINGNQTDNSAMYAGAAYVFSRAGTTWSQQAYVKASNSGADDGFGMSLSLSADGTTLAVSADSEDSAATGVGGNQADNAAADAGAVYVFTRTGSTWSQQSYIKASNTDASDRFGSRVALAGDGSLLAVGAWGEDSAATGIGGNEASNAAPGAGAAYVYKRTGINWLIQAYVKASNAGTGDAFGLAVALATDGSTLAVSATSEASAARGIDGDQLNNSASLAGAAYVFE